MKRDPKKTNLITMLACCAAKRSNKDLLGRGEGKSKTVKKLEDAKSALMKENAELKAELSRVKQNAKKEAEAVLEKKRELEKLQNEMKNLLGQKNGSQDEIAKLRRALQAKQKELSEIDEESKKREERLKNLERESKDEIDKLKEQLKKELKKEDELKHTLDHKENELKTELEKEMDLQKTLTSTKEVLSQSKSARQIFQQYLDVNDEGADILVSLHSFCDVMVRSRGDKRGDEMSDLLEKEIRTDGSQMRIVCEDLYEVAKEDKKTLEEDEFNQFLQVLFKRYNYLMGQRILNEMKKKIDATPEGEEKDLWTTHYDEFNYDVLPAQNAVGIAESCIDESHKTYILENEKKGLDFKDFVEFVCEYMIGFNERYPLLGMYMIKDFEEQLNDDLAA